MKKNNKFLLVFFITLFIFTSNVKAVLYTYESDGTNDVETRFCHDSIGNFDGNYSSTNYCPYGRYKWDNVKYIDGKYAFCVNWGIKIEQKGDWQPRNDWTINNRDSIITGLILKDIGSRGLSTGEAYILKGATLNTYFSRIGYFKDVSSKNYYSSNSNVKKIIDTAVNEYNSKSGIYNVNNGKLPEVSINVEEDKYYLIENENNDGYFSKKVTAQLTPSYGGSISYKISINSTAGTVSFCSDEALTDCKTNYNIPAGSKSYSFYIKANDDASDSKITVTISGSNSTTIPYTILYENTKYSNYQRLMVESSKVITRSSSNEFMFTVPKDSFESEISVIKSTGSLRYMGGASLKLARNGYNSSNYLDAISTGSILVYGDDTPDFFSQDYYVVEEKAPSGYIKSNPLKIYSKDVNNNVTNIFCYNTTTGKLLDSKDACWMDRYSYMCKASDNSGYFETSDLNNCSLEVAVNSEITYDKVCYDKGDKKEVSEEYCTDAYSLVLQVTGTGDDDKGKVKVYFGNRKNKISISKNDGKNEIAGANLKICTASDYNNNKENCSPAKTVDAIELSWTSNNEPAVFEGLVTGSYYVMEVEPPAGYIRTSAVVEFSIDEYGVVTSEGEKLENGLVSVENKQNSLSISKQDIATSEELPGATISICKTTKDAEGNINILKEKDTDECIVAVLADGSEATWVSTNEPYPIEGLPADTYALVEKIAPKGYDTAESIIFTMNDDGTLTDKDGKSLEDNKLVMKDKKIEEVKTGALSLYIVIGTVVLVAGLGLGSYYYMKNKNVVSTEKSKKIRKRKIHKK